MELGGVTGFELLTVYANPFDPAADKDPPGHS
jgi:hypothetical protein